MNEFKEHCDAEEKSDFYSKKNYDQSKSVKNLKTILKAKEKLDKAKRAKS